jgi:hypothetical protein
LYSSRSARSPQRKNKGKRDLGGDDRIAVEIGCALLEFGEILDRFQGALRAEQPLDVHAAERRRNDPMAIGLRTDIADLMRRAVFAPLMRGDGPARFVLV